MNTPKLGQIVEAPQAIQLSLTPRRSRLAITLGTLGLVTQLNTACADDVSRTTSDSATDSTTEVEPTTTETGGTGTDSHSATSAQPTTTNETVTTGETDSGSGSASDSQTGTTGEQVCEVVKGEEVCCDEDEVINHEGSCCEMPNEGEWDCCEEEGLDNSKNGGCCEPGEVQDNEGFCCDEVNTEGSCLDEMNPKEEKEMSLDANTRIMINLNNYAQLGHTLEDTKEFGLKGKEAGSEEHEMVLRWYYDASNNQ